MKAETRRVLADDDNAVFGERGFAVEIVVKRRRGELKADVAAIAARMAPASKIQRLDIAPQHLIALNSLPFHERHRDPFDHLLIAQAISEGMTLVTLDLHAVLYPMRTMPA